ncbi:MAG: protein kinase [Acidimicrobiales bacterium]|nr:protein kinase [Acidimicrobiales bacterium]
MIGSTQIDRYRVHRQLGRGAFAAVHSAADEVLDTTVALKILDIGWSRDPEIRERFIQEARLLRRLDCSAFVRVFDIGETDDGRAWFTMTLAKRGTLADRLDARGGSASWTNADLHLLIDVVSTGLDALRRADVVHRDITPRNLLIDTTDRPDAAKRQLFDPDERLLIADLGLAKDLSAGVDALTMLGGTPRYQAPEQLTPLSSVDHRTDLYAATAVLCEVVTGAPPPTPPELRSRLAELTEPWSRVLARGLAPAPEDRFSSIDEWSTALRALVDAGTPVLAPPVDAEIINPYPGLRAFDESRAAFYSGRELLVDEIVDRLHVDRILIVGGPSGAGKSSVLRAGLIPRIRAGGLGEEITWSVTLLTPGPQPISRLRRTVGWPPTSSEAAEGRSGQILIIDQFEEVLTQCTDPAQREKFIAAIIELSEVGTRTRVILGVRSDFYGPLGSDARLASLLGRHVFVGPMARADLRRAIERPALRVGVPIENSLVEQMVDDAFDAPAALPHVSHALATIFARRSGDRLRLATYLEIGGIAGALAGTADEFTRSLEEDERETLRRLLLRLIVPATGRQPDVRGSATREELSERQRTMVDRLAQHRLVTITDDGVQLAHEALLTSWTQLQKWVDASRADLATANEFRQSARAWHEKGRTADLLEQGSVLEQSEGWVSRAHPDLSVAEADFLRASQARRTRNRRVRQVVASALVLLLVGAVAGAVLALRESTRAEEASQLALARRLASESETALLRADLPLAAVLAVAGDQVSSTEETREALFAALVAEISQSQIVLQHSGQVRAVAARADGMVASGGVDGSVQIWRPDGSIIQLAGHDGEVRDIAFIAGEDRVVSIDATGSVRVWEAGDGSIAEQHVVASPSGAARGAGGGRSQSDSGSGRSQTNTDGARLRAVAVSSDGTLAAVAGDGGIWLWELGNGAPQLSHATDSEVRSIEWREGNDRLVFSDREGRVSELEIGNSRVTIAPGSHNDVAHDVTVVGDTIISVGRDHSIRAWNQAADTTTEIDEAHRAEIYAVSARSDGGELATAGADETIRLWSPENLRIPITELTGHQGDVQDVTYAGSTVVSAGSDGTVRRWVSGRTSAVDTLAETGSEQGVLDLDASEDTEVIVAAGRSGRLIWWTASAGTSVVDAHRDRAQAVELAGPAEAISVGSDGRIVRSTPQGAEELVNLGSPLVSLALTADGRLAYVGDTDGALHEVNLASGEARIVGRAQTRVQAIAIGLASGTVVGATLGGQVLVLDSTTEPSLTEIIDLGVEVRAVEFDPAENFLAIAGASPDVLVLETGKWETAAVLSGHTDAVRDVAWSTNSELLASVSRDSTVRLWDRSWNEIAVSEVHQADTRSVRIGNGAHIVTASNAGEIIRWPGPTQWAIAVCALAARDMTADEWARHAGPDIAPRPVCPQNE